MDKKKALLILLITITSTCIASVGFSAAFFTGDSDINVKDVDISLTSDPTISLGIKNTDGEIVYSDSLTTSELGSIPVFIPVSSMYKSNWLNDTITKVDKPTFKEAYRTGKISDPNTYRETSNATEGYFSKEIYLKASHDCYAMVSDTSTFSPNTTENDKIATDLKDTFPSLTHDEIVTNLNTTYKSLRYSFLYNDKDYLIYDPYKEESTLLASPLDINMDGYYDYYSSNGAYYEFLYGEYQNSDKLLYGSNNFNAGGEINKTTTFSAMTKTNVNHIDLNRSILNGLSVAEEDSISSSELKEMRHLFLLKGNEPYRVVLSIYLEGWDLDNTSLAMYGAFNASLTFTLTEETIYG